MESGNPVNVNVFNGTDFYQPLYDAIVNQTGCAGQFDTLQCLRTVPFGRLNNVFNATPFDSGFAPVVDGDFIQRYGSLQCSDGDFVCVPIISGANTDEGVSFGPVGINDAAGFHHYLEQTPQAVGVPLSSNLSQQILAAYPMPTGAGMDGIPADVAPRPSILGPPVPSHISTWTTNGVPAYCYRFNAIPAGQQYVAHVQEIPFVFNSIQGYGYRTPPFQNKSQSYIDLARFMTISWASFVHDLDPNSFRASNASVAGRRRGGRCRM